jgi:hypothetical protein
MILLNNTAKQYPKNNFNRVGIRSELKALFKLLVLVLPTINKTGAIAPHINRLQLIYITVNLV